MGIIVFFVFICLWSIPILKNYKKFATIDTKALLKALLLGLIPCSLICILSDNVLYVVLEMISNLLVKFTNLSIFSKDSILFQLIDCYLIVALIEESTKYAFAKKAVKGLDNLKRIDYVILFGCVGLGYEIIETLMFSLKGNEALMGICRGVFIPHVMYQMYMGYHYYDVINNGNTSKNLFLVPYLIHGTNDFLLEIAQILLLNEINESLGVVVFILVVILNVFATVKCYKTFKRSCN